MITRTEKGTQATSFYMGSWKVPRENLRDKALGSIFAPAQPTEKGKEGRGAVLYSRQEQAVCSCWSLDKAHPPGGDLSAVGGPRSS